MCTVPQPQEIRALGGTIRVPSFHHKLIIAITAGSMVYITKFREHYFGHLNNIKVTTSEIREASMLVILMERMFELRR
jgi:hypothetical protein